MFSTPQFCIISIAQIWALQTTQHVKRVANGLTGSDEDEEMEDSFSDDDGDNDDDDMDSEGSDE